MATLQITKKLYVIPLIDVQIATSAERYVTGVRLWLFGWREHGEVEAQGPLPAYYLIDNPKRCAQINRFDGCHEESLRKDIGFFLGLLHGGVLTPDGTLRPDAKTLVFLHTQDFREGYECGRWDYFTHYEEIVQKDNDLLDPGESKARSVGRLAVPLENTLGDSSRWRSHNSVHIQRSPRSSVPFCKRRKRRDTQRGA